MNPNNSELEKEIESEIGKAVLYNSSHENGDPRPYLRDEEMRYVKEKTSNIKTLIRQHTDKAVAKRVAKDLPFLKELRKTLETADTDFVSLQHAQTMVDHWLIEVSEVKSALNQTGEKQ